VSKSGPKLSVESIARALGLGEKEFTHRKDYLGLSAMDVQLLRELAEPLRDLHPKLMDVFYAHLQQFPETRNYFQDPQLVEQLRQKQADYFHTLLDGEYDQAYLHDRLKVGFLHQQAGLSTDWYIGAYAKFLTTLLPELATLADGDTAKLASILSALIKIVFLDINLVLDTYAYADKLSIQALKDYAENLICNTPLGLIVVSKDMNILSANQYMHTRFGIPHRNMQGKPLTQFFPCSGLNDRAIEVLSTGRPQYGVHLTLNSATQGNCHCEISLTPFKQSSPDSGIDPQPALLIVMEDTTERDSMIEMTQSYDNRVRAILNNIAEGIITIDEHGSIESFNPAAEKLFGYKAGEIVGRNVSQLMPSPYQDMHDHYLQQYAASHKQRCLGRGFREVEGLHRNGTSFPIDLSISELKLPEKNMFIGIIRDASQRKHDEAEMAKLSLAIEQTADTIMITDKQGFIEYVNCGFENTTGYQRSNVLGKRPSILKSGLQDSDFYQGLWQQVEEGRVFQNVFINRKKNGDLYYEEKTITPLRNQNGDITHYISTGKDITDRMRTQKRLHFLAHHDALTALPNRMLLMERIEHAISHCKRSRKPLALLFLDLDRFKKINDTLGHNTGDKLLRQLSTRLKLNLRQDDTVARLSGDEFAILLQDIEDIDSVLPIISKIKQQLCEPFRIESRELFISASIGVAVCPHDGDDPDTLLKNADTAMYAAKANGRGSFSFYTADMNAMASMHLQMENELRYALQRNQFELEFQPQFSLDETMSIAGAEVLVRWQHPELGLLGPGKFIPLLEDTGLIQPVGKWIIHTACAQLRAWHDANFMLPRIAINIAPHQLGSPDFIDAIFSALEEFQLPPHCLELEITESSLMQDENRAVEILNTLNHKGIHIAMDDFGTGYSSLSYLQRLPVNTLKIDRSFISQIPHVNSDSILTRTIIAMGRSLNLRIVAEGVEADEQLEYLRSLGCDAVQGFLLGRPMRAAELQNSLATRAKSSR
jgi:diguanylate cyclase (GGDEF)-like protein/PAS domain S-box-containing protein